MSKRQGSHDHYAVKNRNWIIQLRYLACSSHFSKSFHWTMFLVSTRCTSGERLTQVGKRWSLELWFVLKPLNVEPLNLVPVLMLEAQGPWHPESEPFSASRRAIVSCVLFLGRVMFPIVRWRVNTMCLYMDLRSHWIFPVVGSFSAVSRGVIWRHTFMDMAFRMENVLTKDNLWSVVKFY